MIKYLFSNIDKVNGFSELQSKYLSKDLRNCNIFYLFLVIMIMKNILFIKIK